METLADFVKRLSNAVGCFYHITEWGDRYSLQKHKAGKRNYVCVFAWVYETKDAFKIETYECFADQQGIDDADVIKANMNYGKTGLRFSVVKNSNGNDYKNVVKALRTVMHNKCGQC